MKRNCHGLLLQSICTSTLAVSSRLSCQATAVLLWIIIRDGKIRTSIPPHQEIAEHYGTEIIPASVQVPKDRSNAEDSVCNIFT